MLLYPQLLRTGAKHLVREIRSIAPQAARRQAKTSHPDQMYSPTGGAPAPVDHLREIRDGLRRIADDEGFPEKQAPARRVQFDYYCSVFLYESLRISPAEASRPGVWEFFCCVLVPDLVRWRYPGGEDGTTEERFLAGIRNTFFRLWWRAFLLADEEAADTYRLLEFMREDEFVQITERPTLAGSRRLARATAREFIDCIERHEVGGSRMVLMREAQKRIMRLFGVVEFEALTEHELSSSLHAIFEHTHDAIR